MRIGVCTDPKYGSVLAQAGFDFVELNVQGHLKTLEDEAAFAPSLEQIRASALPSIAANSLVPGHLKITGPEVDLEALDRYVERASSRAAQAGVSTLVFGSGGARQVPEGFSRERAWEQLLAFGKVLGDRAAQHGLMFVVEPLNVAECNILNTVGECGRYVEAVDHPNVRLLVDAYHWLRDGDSYEAIVRYGPLLRHAHIATATSRLAPGLEPCDFSAFFRALREAGYAGPISIEAGWADLPAQAAEARRYLSDLIEA